MAPNTTHYNSTAGLDPLKDLFEGILGRLEALETKVGVAPPNKGHHGHGGGSLSGASSHEKTGGKRMSIVNSECKKGEKIKWERWLILLGCSLFS